MKSRLLALALVAISHAATTNQNFVSKTTCARNSYTYESLVGYGFVVSDFRDKFGDTLGGFGSAIALDTAKWVKSKDGSYTGVLYGLPDRGWNTQGTTNFWPRIHKFSIVFTPTPSATAINPSPTNLVFNYLDTILLYAPDGTSPTTGLDPDGVGHITYPGFPDLPGATISGDGFGTPGPVTHAIAIDAEGLALSKDGGFWISDEYGPYVYHFNSDGIMTAAIRPPDALIPMRNGTESFSADSPPFFPNQGAGHDVIPNNNPTGRNNNKGFEGLTLTADGKTLYVALQAAANQEGGLGTASRRYTRLLQYDISKPSKPKYKKEFVIPLPFQDATHKKVAAQSEIHHLKDDTFFILSRDSGAGAGQTSSTSIYRAIDVFSLSHATDISGAKFDCTTCAIASSSGILKPGITPAEYCHFIDFNLNSELAKFGIHNGGVQDGKVLNEKWESIALMPVDGKEGKDGEWFVLSISDNDFVTQNGFFGFGEFTYQDASGFSLDNQALLFKVILPKGAIPDW